MFEMIRPIVKKLFPQAMINGFRRVRYDLRNFGNGLKGIPAAPIGTDLVGYEALCEFILSKDLLSVEGDLVEIGTFLGGGAYKLCKLLEKRRSLKRLFVVDVFDPTFDWTVNAGGNAMANLYLNALKPFKGRSQYEVFSDVTRALKNLVVIKGDSKNIQIPTSRLCFGFIDGNHDPEYVENDFNLIWGKLSAKGAISFHDYEWDLPQTTAKINDLIDKHALEIQSIYQQRDKHILFIVKKSPDVPNRS